VPDAKTATPSLIGINVIIAPSGDRETQDRAPLWNIGRSRLKWDKDAAEEGERSSVFCASLADVFDDEVPAEWRRDLFELIGETPNLDWYLLTKRPENIRPLG
jgi:protein gp37